MSRPWLPLPALRAGLLLTAAGGFAVPALAEPVDVELILAVDVSLSMSPDELAIQRDGYAAALTHGEVIRAIEDGMHGRIALAYVEWAGDSVQHVIVPWTIIANGEDARRVAERLTVAPSNSARRTSISGVLDFAADLFAESAHRGMRRVVDVSGDGPNNQGVPVTQARDALVAQGVTINGLPLMTTGRGYAGRFDLAELDAYYRDCVIGGPGAFMIPVNDWSHFPEAVRRKLVLELAGGAGGRDALPVLRASVQAEGTDCMIGEKMWLNRSWMWEGDR
ncbi:MAG: DUF1194 domain-containing protein [Aquamicrobium sp.]|uniref:DUF1194 domain-containing protein n=1 Tax=Aquamicrobium sp. TaxID=1872579 RepID=UPI00349EE458|nr:DUF1194 domain-containing protein [Aquamicrobium sp.]